MVISALCMWLIVKVHEMDISQKLIGALYKDQTNVQNIQNIHNI